MLNSLSRSNINIYNQPNNFKMVKKNNLFRIPQKLGNLSKTGLILQGTQFVF